MADRAAEILSQVSVADSVRAKAWDAFYGASSPDDFTTKLKRIPLPDSVKADLWDAKYQPTPKPVPIPQPAANVPGFDEQHPIAAKVLDAGSSTLGFIGNMLQGATKSAAETIFHPRAGEDVDQSYAMGKGLAYTPAYVRTPEEAEANKPHGVAQHIGAIGEQTAEMMATGGPLRNIASKAGRPVLARIGAEALNAGGSAALHDQNIPAAMALGAGGSATGELMQKVAPKLAESALGVRSAERAYGKTPGAEMLKSIPGNNPAEIASAASRKALDLTGTLESAAEQVTEKASLKPALSVVDSAIETAKRENNAAVLSKLNSIRNQLTTDITATESGPAYSGILNEAGKPILSANQPASAEIGEMVSPRKLLDLKRGIGDLVESWGPGGKGMRGIKKQVYHALDSELDRVLPGAADMNQQISSLIAISKSAQRTAGKSSLPNRVLSRIGSHALSGLPGAALGGAIGYQHGGYEGAGVGAFVGGTVAPELLATPSLRVMLARGASKATPQAIRPLEAAIMQATRKKR